MRERDKIRLSLKSLSGTERYIMSQKYKKTRRKGRKCVTCVLMLLYSVYGLAFATMCILSMYLVPWVPLQLIFNLHGLAPGGFPFNVELGNAVQRVDWTTGGNCSALSNATT